MHGRSENRRNHRDQVGNPQSDDFNQVGKNNFLGTFARSFTKEVLIYFGAEPVFLADFLFGKEVMKSKYYNYIC
jgi:hypothetical protein